DPVVLEEADRLEHVAQPRARVAGGEERAAPLAVELAEEPRRMDAPEPRGEGLEPRLGRLGAAEGEVHSGGEDLGAARALEEAEPEEPLRGLARAPPRPVEEARLRVDLREAVEGDSLPGRGADVAQRGPGGLEVGARL